VNRVGDDQDTFTSELPVTRQSAEARQEMRLRVSDWKRIRRDVRRLHPSWASGWFSGATLFLGLGVGSGLSLVSLYNQAGGSSPKDWIIIVHSSVTAGCAVGCFICLIGGCMEYMRYRKRKNDLQQELDIFEHGFPWSNEGGAESTKESHSETVKRRTAQIDRR
jgi:hypothetical protein